MISISIRFYRLCQVIRSVFAFNVRCNRATRNFIFRYITPLIVRLYVVRLVDAMCLISCKRVRRSARIGTFPNRYVNRTAVRFKVNVPSGFAVFVNSFSIFVCVFGLPVAKFKVATFVVKCAFFWCVFLLVNVMYGIVRHVGSFRAVTVRLSRQLSRPSRMIALVRLENLYPS